ncbi:MAG: hypothetical protein ACTSXQ_03565 [Alphaproteobacteria bacterium]
MEKKYSLKKKSLYVLFCMALLFSMAGGVWAKAPLAWIEQLPKIKYDHGRIVLDRYVKKVKKENNKLQEEEIKVVEKMESAIGRFGKVRPPTEMPDFIIDEAFGKDFLKEVLMLDATQKYDDEVALSEAIRRAFYYDAKKSPQEWKDYVKKVGGMRMKVRSERHERALVWKRFMVARGLFYTKIMRERIEELRKMNADLFTTVDPKVAEMIEGLMPEGAMDEEAMGGGMGAWGSMLSGVSEDNKHYLDYLTTLKDPEKTKALGDIFESGDSEALTSFLDDDIGNLAPDKQEQIRDNLTGAMEGDEAKGFGSFLKKMAGDENILGGMTSAIDQMLELSDKYGMTGSRLTIRSLVEKQTSAKQVQAMYIEYMNLTQALVTTVKALDTIIHSRVYDDPFDGIKNTASLDNVEKTFVLKEKKLQGGFLTIVLPKINLAENSVLFAEQKRKENRKALREKRLELAVLGGFK